MMKKYIALGVALVLLLSLTACGSKGDNNPDKDPVTTTTVIEDVTDGTTTDSSADGTTAVADGDATTAVGGSASNGGATNGTQKTEPPTTQYIPGGTQVPIGTRPPTTTTATKAPTTTTTVTGSASVGGGTTASAATTTTTTTVVTTTTTTVAKPTNPPANQHYIALPEIGTDIDVTGKKDRIRVSDAYAWFNEDGSIGVGLTFKNYTSNWITEETDYVQYICYAEDGTPLKRGTISIGVIDTKKHPVRTYEFDVPADTYEVKLVKSKITYWTEWA